MRGQQRVVPVYMVMGMLEGGKTYLINSMLKDENFSRGQKTLILCCEEGIEEYDEALLEKRNCQVIMLDDADELTSLKLKTLDKEYKPERIIMEYNTMWTLEKLGSLNLPPYWEYVQVIVMVNGGTFDNYMTNMRKLMTDPMKEADLIMVNRCKPEDPKSAWRRQMKAINTGCNIMFENLDGSTEDGVADEDLPYDMKAEIINIPDEDIGTFYLDSLDHPERYDGKTVRLVGQAYRDPRDGMPDGFYLFSRQAMTCCADDIARIGWVTRGMQKPHKTNYFTLTATCHKMDAPDGSQSVLMLQEKKVESARTPDEPYLTFN